MIRIVIAGMVLRFVVASNIFGLIIPNIFLRFVIAGSVFVGIVANIVQKKMPSLFNLHVTTLM